IPMATIIITDLTRSKAMDRQAMRAVAGGSPAPHVALLLRNKSTVFLNSPLKLTSRWFESGSS
ncbi:MAG: hypothetical protein GY938_20865, partial [Ketobacter sp.]|nr:hypothetical protein [Ketobacter sp.]